MANKRFVHSFSAKKMFDQCPERFFQDRVLRRFPFRQSPEAAEGSRKHKLIENAINLKTRIIGNDGYLEPLVDKLRTYGGTLKAEVKLGITRGGKACGYFDAAVYYRAVLDVVQVDEDGKHARVYDWKFGSAKYPDVAQLVENALCVFAHYPTVETVEAKLVWPDVPHIEVLVFDRAHFDDYLEDLVGACHAIDEVMESGEYPRIASPLCPWCPITDCPNWSPKPEKRQ